MSAEPVPSRRRAAPGLWLLVCAGVSLALYGLCFAAAFPLAQNYATPLRDLGKLTNHSPEGAVQFFGAFAVLFGLYALVYRIADGPLARLSSAWRLIILSAPLLFVLPLIATYPVGAADVFDYSFFARMIGHYGANPMVHAPADFPGDAWLAFVGWPRAASPYGPLWQELSALVFMFARDDLAATIVAFKLLATGSLLLCAALAYLILRDWQPHNALKAFVFVAWNPLLLFETAVNAHNDAVMMAFVLLALRMQQRRRFSLAIISLVMAAFIKFPAIIGLPMFALVTLRTLSTWRARAGWVLTTAAGALLVAGLAYLPVATGPNPFSNLGGRDSMFTTSFATLFVFFTRTALGIAPAQALAIAAAYGLLSGLLLWLFFSLDGTLASLTRATYLAMFALLVTATVWFQPWYLIWLVPLAPLTSRGARLVAGIFSASVLAAYLIFGFALFWAPDLFARDDGLTLNLFSVPLVLGPPLLAAAARSVRSRQRANRRPAEWVPGQQDRVARA